MIKNFITTAVRNLIRNKSYSILNISGLAIGIFAFIIIMLFVQDEMSYDQYHENSANIYRVNCLGSLAGSEFNFPVSPAPVGRAFVEEIPGVANFTRLRNLGAPVLRYNGKAFSEERWFRADSNVFDVFSIDLYLGDKKTALTKPNTVVISESMAKKYFGNEDPIGKILNSDNRIDIQVTGVFRDVPHNSHLKYDFLGSMVGFQDADSPVWVSNNYLTYLLFDDGITAEDVESKFPAMVLKYAGPQIEQFLGVSWDKLVENGAHYGFYLMKMTDIHLKSNLELEQENTGTIIYVRIFSIVALFILIIACINFMNLATARSAKRGKEVGIRKTLGAYKKQLIAQFITESLIVSAISVVLAGILVALLLPMFNNMVELNLSFDPLSNSWILPVMGALILIVGVVSGAYPAFFMSSINPVQVLKGGTSSGKKNKILRSSLVVFQFVVSITLFAGTMVISNQIKFIQNKDLGYQRDNVVIIEKTDDIRANLQEFKLELAKEPKILSISNSNSLFGHGYNNTIHAVEGQPRENSALVYMDFSDVGYVETYQLDLINGRSFIFGEAADSNAVILNQAAVGALQLGDDPLGKRIQIPGFNDGFTTKVIGIVKNFHTDNLRFPIKPMAIYLNRPGGGGRYTAIRIAEEDQQSTIAFAESVWKKYAGDQAFEYIYLEDDFRQQYKIEGMTRMVSIIFTILAILIACMGLFGLASYTLEQRNKEIALRKVLGASVSDLYTLLSMDTLKHVGIATVIAWPIAYYFMSGWLENFTYRIGFSHLIVLIGFIASIVLSLVTVANQTLKAATANPIKAIKYE